MQYFLATEKSAYSISNRDQKQNLNDHFWYKRCIFLDRSDHFSSVANHCCTYNAAPGAI